MFIRRYGETDFLTGMRTIAILAVFLIHSGGMGLRSFGNWGNFIVDCGKYGVQIFFVISGFTIFNQIFKENTDLKKFTFIRIARISIPYYPVIIFLFLFNYFGGYQYNGWTKQFTEGSITLINLLAHMIYISPFNIKWQNTIIGVEWTLGIEVFYYLVFAIFVYYGIAKNNIKSFFKFGIIAFFVSLLSIKLQKSIPGSSLFMHWFPTQYFYMFFLGALSYFLRKKFQEHKLIQKHKKILAETTTIVVVLVFAIFVLLSSFKIVNWLLVELFFALATFLIITFYNQKAFLSKFLTSKPMLFLGTISYSFYLLHGVILWLLPKTIGEKNFFQNSIILLLISILLSIAWYYIFEHKIYFLFKEFIKRINFKREKVADKKTSSNTP